MKPQTLKSWNFVLTCLCLAGFLSMQSILVQAEAGAASPQAIPAPILVKDVNPGANSGVLSQFEWVGLLNINGVLFFAGNQDTTGVELWKSTGAQGETSLVKDINPNVKLSWPTGFTQLKTLLIFVANDGTHGKEIWKSDGTTAGTQMVKDINPTGSAEPSWLTRCGDYVFFNAEDGVHGTQLWKTDGTAAGTTLVKNVAMSGPVEVNGTLYFSVNGGASVYDNYLWKSDGSEGGTQLVKDFYGGGLSLVNLNGKLVFSAYGDSIGTELWTSNGTPAGTVLVKDIQAGYFAGSNPHSFVTLGTAVYFFADDGIHGDELWKSNGTSDGTQLVKDIHPSAGSYSPSCRAPCLVAVKNTLFFTASDGVNGAELWKSDGTPDGTLLVKDIYSSGGSNPGLLTAAGGLVFFNVSTGYNSANLWVSDGTLAGTAYICGFSSGPDLLTVVNNWLFMAGDNGSIGKELWALRFEDLNLPRKIFLPALRK
jgi:trimeric autotransporter adhesin